MGIYLYYWNSAQIMYNKWDKNLVNIFKLIVENGILKNIKVNRASGFMRGKLNKIWRVV